MALVFYDIDLVLPPLGKPVVFSASSGKKCIVVFDINSKNKKECNILQECGEINCYEINEFCKWAYLPEFKTVEKDGFPPVGKTVLLRFKEEDPKNVTCGQYYFGAFARREEQNVLSGITDWIEYEAFN